GRTHPPRLRSRDRCPDAEDRATVTDVTSRHDVRTAMSMTSDLQGRRLDALRAWTAFVEHGDDAEEMVRPEILRSWQRSQPRVSRDVSQAPLDDESDARAFWRD